jgi:protein-disulfide isomerase/uncharacterized membrane protein
MRSTTRAFRFSLMTTLASIANHAYLTYHYYDFKLGLSGTPSFCNINSTFNCDVVTASNYSNISGIPVAMLGLFAHLILLLFLAVIRLRLSSNSQSLEKVTLALTCVVAAISLVMGSISTFLISSFCLFCMLAYALSFLNLFFIYRALDSSTVSWSAVLGDLVRDQKWILVFLIAVPAASWVGNKMVLDSYGFRQIDRLLAESKYTWQNATVQNFDLNAGLLLTAEQTPKMTIVEFADFRCSHCKTAAPVLHSFVNSRKDVSLIYKFFPLDGNCNTALPQKGDGSSCLLAASALCGEKIAKKGFVVHDWIYQNQQQFYSGVKKDELLKSITQLTGINADEFKACIDAPETMSAVQASALEGSTAKIQGTPTIFVNGKRLDGGQFMPVLEEVYKSL